MASHRKQGEDAEMGYMMRRDQAHLRHIEAEERRRTKAGHDDAAMRRAMYLVQLHDQKPMIDAIAEAAREVHGDEAAEKIHAEYEQRIADVRAEGPIGCSCGCTA